MKIITMASQKGGSGKSTLAIHLATLSESQGVKTLLVDLDPHSRTTEEWGSMRESETPVVVPATADELDDILTQAKNAGFQQVVLDLPPFVDDETEKATRQADITLIPCRPSFSNVRAIARSMPKIHPPRFVVLNHCQPRRSGIEASKTSEVRHLLEEGGIPACPLSITHYVAFDDALNGGESVTEYEGKGKAAVEIKRLFKWVNAEIQN
ncbi:MAG: AAA family ATPase [Candidatus Sedimenticola sp. (ex Thyasira tokunagai)]